MAFIDGNTLNVQTVLVIDMAGAILIFFGFLWVRSIRGDRKAVRSSYTNKMVTEVVFEDSMQDSKVQDSLDYHKIVLVFYLSTKDYILNQHYDNHKTPNPTQGATTKGGLNTDYKHSKDINKENLQYLNTDKGLKYLQQDPNRKSYYFIYLQEQKLVAQFGE